MKETTTLVPSEYVNNGNWLFNWLGLFWQSVFADSKLVKQLQTGNGLLAGQLYLKFQETEDLLNRNLVPVYHRERWYPITLRLSERDTGSAARLRLGMDPLPLIGPQTSSEFPQGEIFQAGGNIRFESLVGYPMGDAVVDIVTCVTDRIQHPDTVLVNGTDFIVEDGTIYFKKEVDPFDSGAFPRRTVQTDDGALDEIILWGCSALFDNEYIQNYIGYVLNTSGDFQSSTFFQRMLNGLWDVHNAGTNIARFKAGLGAILGEPVVKETTETVDRILTTSDAIQVITDSHVYSLHVDATLRSAVVPGAVLEYGSFLTETIRLYETLDPMKLNAVSEYGERLKEDAHAMFFGKELFRTDMRYGIGASWDDSDIVNTGLDANGNPKLKFDLYGAPEDVTAFWTDFWSYLEARNLSSETCFEEYLYDIVTPSEGEVYGSVPPLEYFMRYFLRANAVIVVVEREHLSSAPEDVDSVALLRTLKGVLPAHILLFIVEHRYVSDEYDLSDLGSDYTQTYATTATDAARPGLPSTVTLTYRDHKPVISWIPGCLDNRSGDTCETI